MAFKFYVSLVFFIFGLTALATLGHARETPGFAACKASRPRTIGFYAQIYLEGENSCKKNITDDGKTYTFSCKLTQDAEYSSPQIGTIEGIIARVVYKSGENRDFLTDTFTLDHLDGPPMIFNSKGVIDISNKENVFPVNGGMYGPDHTIIGRYVQYVVYAPPILLLNITATLYIIPYTCNSILMKVE